MPADGGTAPAIAPAAPHPGRTTQLMYACSQGDLKQVQKILQEQPSTLHHLDRTCRTPLHYCAGGAVTSPATLKLPPGARLTHCADLLLMASPDLVHTRDQDGFTPLHLAVIAGNVQLVQFLLANGADVGCKDEEGHSVVHWATVCGETAALQAVLAAGADISSPDVHGGYPIHYAAQMCGSEKPELGLQVLHILLSTPSIKVTVTDNDGRQPLLWAASAGSARAVLALVRAGAAVESSDKDGLTALHCAASRGHTDTLDTLLTLCGAQTDVIDSNGCTALHYSVTLGHADATALLLSHSADPNLQDRKGRSPAHCGCAKGQLETVRQLHAAGANLWLRTARGDLPLHEAAGSGRRQLVKWLLDQRPSQVNARNNDGRGLLHLAALNDNADMCKILLDSGAAINPLLRTSKNIFMTPLDCALQRGFRSTAKFLQLHGGVPASRLNTLRLTSEVASNVSVGSRLHIREDITVFGGSSSEEVEDPLRSKDHRTRRKTVRRKLSYRHERRSFSGSEADKGEKIVKKYEERRSKSRDAAVKSKHSEAKPDKSRKKKQTETEESISDSETSPEIRRDTKTSLKSDIEINISKKLQPDESNHEITDIEKSRKITSDRERRKNKKEDKDSSLEKEQKKKKSRSGNDEQDLISEQEHKDSKAKPAEDKITKKSESEITKKSKKSDISDSDTQRNKISDSETRRKKSASKNDQIESKVDAEIIEKLEKQETEEKSKKELEFEAQEDKSLEADVSKETNELQKQVDEPDLVKESAETAKIEETKPASLESLKEAELAQELVEQKEQSPELIQPDQISLQSKMSEESPSEIIVVEASVHHPPKGIDAEEIKEETTKITEEKEEILQENGTEEAKNVTEESGVKIEETEPEITLQKEETGKSDLLPESEEKEDTDTKLPEATDTKLPEAPAQETSEEATELKPADTTKEIEESKDVPPSEETSTSVPIIEESSTKETETLEQTTETEDQKKEDSKKELSIDLSLKKFEETAEQQNEATDENEKVVENGESNQKKYRKKVKVKNGKEEESSSRETSSSESESQKSVKKADKSNGEHKSFKILHDDVAFEVLKDSPKEKRAKKTKKRAKIEIPESATSSPEMLESVRSKSVSRQRETLILPSLTEKRPESNLSAPNLSFLSDDQKSGSNTELDEVLSSASRKKRLKKRSKLRMGSKSAGSDYESSNLIDSGFEPSPRSSRIPKRKVMSERGVNMTSVTQQIQSNIRRYHMERKIFQHLLDLKRLQIRSGQANEFVLVKRAIDNYHNSVAATVGAGRYLKKDFTYRSFEQFLYESLRMLQKSPSDNLRGLSLTSDNPLLCTQSTHRCLHATHAYTGIPCAAYLPKMNHHTMPKIGFTPRSTSSFLPQISSKGKSVTLELCHGNDKQVISLPADKLDHNKRYYVTFTVKGQETSSPIDQEHTSHRHAKSV